MRVWDSVAGWQRWRSAIAGQRIGFVPTMGALHRGHESLIERCRGENEIAVVSIFVNPSQFNDPKDLERYPRTFAQDCAILEKLGVDELLAPAAQDLYPHGYRFRVEAEFATSLLEGTCRPGFLQGVMTIVLKLLNLVRPDRAYFGEKDFQQFRTVSEMVKEFFIPAEIVACPTVRAESGLAESSRNSLLSAMGRDRAAGLFRALSTAASCEEAIQRLEAEGFRVEYVEERWGRRLAAVFLESVRLIDNVLLPDTGSRGGEF